MYENPFSPPSKPLPDYTPEELSAPDTIRCRIGRGPLLLALLITTIVAIVVPVTWPSWTSWSKYNLKQKIAMTVGTACVGGLCAISVMYCCRERLWITRRAIVRQGVFFRTSMAIADVRHIRWYSESFATVIEIRGLQRRMIIPLYSYGRRDQNKAIVRCRQMLSVDQQAGWCEIFESHFRFPVTNDGLESTP